MINEEKWIRKKPKQKRELLNDNNKRIKDSEKKKGWIRKSKTIPNDNNEKMKNGEWGKKRMPKKRWRRRMNSEPPSQNKNQKTKELIRES